MELSNVLSEAYDILNILGNDYISKIPKSLFEYIKYERNDRKINNFDIEKNIDEQDLSIEAIEFISYLNLQYWSNEEQKMELIKKYKENELNYEKMLKEKYNYNNILKNETTKEVVIKEQLVEIKKDNIILKIINKIKDIFRRNKNG